MEFGPFDRTDNPSPAGNNAVQTHAKKKIVKKNYKKSHFQKTL